jgi:glycosyltransferase involved in cell wall biosynthesis
VVVVSRESIATSWAAELQGAEVAAPVSDLRRFLHGQVVAVAPLGSDVDMRAAMVEPMAAGVPVVATPALCQQVGATAGRDLLVADQPVDFAREVVRLLESASLRRELADQGRRFAEASYSWGVYAARVTEVIERVLKPPQSTAPAPPPGIAAVLSE